MSLAQWHSLPHSTLSYFVSFTLSRPPVLFTKLHQETIEREKIMLFAYMAASVYHVISKEAGN